MRGLNALQLALGAVGGGISGYQTAQARRLEEERLKRAEARQSEQDKRQREMDLFNALKETGYGFESVRTTPDAAARGVTALETPEIPTTMGETPLRSALGRATQAGMGVSGKPTGMLDTPVSLALDTTKRQQFERGAAMQPATQAEKIAVGGMPMGLVSPEEMARRKAKSQVDVYREQRQIDVQTDAEKKENERRQKESLDKQTATLIQATYRKKDGTAFGDKEALYMAQQGKTPFELGLLEKQMTESERKNIAARWAELSLNREKFNFEKEQGPAVGKKGGSTDPIQMRVRAGMNEMLLANKAMDDFEQKFKAGQVNITVGQRVLQKLATDFSNEKTPLDKIITSSAYKALAEANPDLVEYMRNVDAFAEGETMISSRPSNFRTKMAQFLSGIAAGSPVEVVNRVQQRRRGLLAPMVQGYYEGDWNRAMQEAAVEAQTPAGQAPPAPAKTAAEAWMDANPQRSGETDAAYKARYQASQRGGRR